MDNMSDVQTVGAYAFDGCNVLRIVAYHREQRDWYQIGYADGNQKLQNAYIMCRMTINAKVDDPATGRLRCRIDGGELSGPVSFVQETVMADSRVELIPVPAEGYCFEKWKTSKGYDLKKPLSSYDCPLTICYVGGLEPVAHFRKIPERIGATELKLPDGLTELGADAFKGIAVRAVLLGENVTKIGAGAFADCPRLEQITFLAADVQIDGDPFENLDKTKPYCYAPAGSETARRLRQLKLSVIEE